MFPVQMSCNLLRGLKAMGKLNLFVMDRGTRICCPQISLLVNVNKTEYHKNAAFFKVNFNQYILHEEAPVQSSVLLASCPR